MHDDCDLSTCMETICVYAYANEQADRCLHGLNSLLSVRPCECYCLTIVHFCDFYALARDLLDLRAYFWCAWPVKKCAMTDGNCSIIYAQCERLLNGTSLLFSMVESPS